MAPKKNNKRKSGGNKARAQGHGRHGAKPIGNNQSIELSVQNTAGKTEPDQVDLTVKSNDLTVNSSEQPIDDTLVSSVEPQDVPTLVNDMSKGQLVEDMLREPKQFTPTTEQLKPVDDGKPVPVEDEPGLPWESGKAEPLPWESDEKEPTEGEPIRSESVQGIVETETVKESAVPEQQSAIPEQESAIPEQERAVPEQERAVPEQERAVPEPQSHVSESSNFPWESKEPSALPWEQAQTESDLPSVSKESESNFPWEDKESASLPWESTAESSLPWGDNVQQTSETSAPIGDLSSKVESLHLQNTPQQEVIPQNAEDTEVKHESAAEGAAFPWEGDEQTEKLPWEEKVGASSMENLSDGVTANIISSEVVPSQEISSREVQPRAEISPSNGRLPWEPNEELLASNENLPWESNENNLPEIHLSEQVDTNLTAAENNDSFFDKLAEQEIIVPKGEVNMNEVEFEHVNSVAHSEITSKPESITTEISKKKSLDEIFGEDDDLLDDFGSDETQENQGLDQKFTEKEPGLDFLDDDLLMEDESQQQQPIEPTPSMVSKPQVPPKSHKSYAPTTKTSYNYSTENPVPLQQNTTSRDFAQKLENAKKKNDAYDFPANFMPPVKPAARNHNKYSAHASTESSTPSAASSASGPSMVSNPYAPKSSHEASTPNPYAPTAGSAPPTGGSIPPTSSSVPPTGGFAPPTGNAPHTGTTNNPPPAFKYPAAQPEKPAPTTTKNFFEDLPIQLPTVTKPARAASSFASSKASTTSNSPKIPRQSPQLHKPVVNPYAVVANSAQASQGPVRKISNPSTTVNTNVGKPVASQTSPYVPNIGPYAPSGHNRAHSRTNSLIGGKGKEHNPYAPILPPVSSGTPQPSQAAPVNQASNAVYSPNLAVPSSSGFISSINGPTIGQIPPVSQSSAHPAIAPPSFGSPGHTLPVNNIPVRPRGASNPKTGLYGRARAQSLKVSNPQALLQRQFPIFNWSNSNQISVLIPAGINSEYHSGVGNVQIRSASTLFKDRIGEFPGPLTKGKGKKKEIEKWLASNISFLQQLNDPFRNSEILVNQFLAILLKFDGNVKSTEFTKEICKILNPTLDYNTPISTVLPSMGVSPTANKLDQSGVNHVFQLLQVGRIEDALSFAITKGDWALSLILSMSINKERFNRVASDFARISYPFQKSNNKVHHMMPVVLKIIAGNGKSVIEDFKNVPSEGEWFANHWGELIAILVINSNGTALEFLQEFAKYLKSIGNSVGSECCYMLCGTPLGLGPSPSEGFSYVGSFTSCPIYSEIYEYIIQLANGPISAAHLLPLKLKHAQMLADYGYSTEAQRYGDYIGQSLKNSGRNPYFTPQAFHEFQKLMVRISDAETESSWFGGKISKVNLDKMWGHLDKFIGGEESKPTEGVFSKFSPSVSRTNSVLDFTAAPQNSNPYSQGSPLQKEGTIAGMPPVGFDGRSKSVGGGRIMQPPVRTPMQEHDSNFMFSSPSTNSRYAPSNASASDLMGGQSVIGGTNGVNNGQTAPALRRLPSKYASGASATAATAANAIAPNVTARQPKPYQNHAAAISNSSLGSAPVNPPVNFYGSNSATSSSPLVPPNQFSTQKRPSISSVLSENYHQEPIHNVNHRHSPSAQSIQSDISLDYPSEFKARRESVDNGPDQSSKSTLDQPYPGPPPASQLATEIVKEVAEEYDASNEPNNAVDSSPSSNGKIDVEDTPSKVPSDPVSVSSTGPPPVTAPPPGPPPGPASRGPAKGTGRKANPYAPGTTRRAVGRAGGKYANPNASAVSTSASSYQIPQVSSSDMFSLGGYQAESTPNETTEQTNQSTLANTKGNGTESDSMPNSQNASESITNNVSEKRADSVEFQQIEQESHQDQERQDEEQEQPSILEASSPQLQHQGLAPPHIPRQTPARFSNKPNAKDELFRPTNIDESFEAADNSDLATPKPKSPLTLNKGKSMFSPYQGDMALQKPSAFGIDSTFNEFPIPGSPDLTTRANSVVNGMGGGLFSSRLSQSQQSAMYQQYEVQDDTVQDYIPVVEEEDDDSDDERASKRKKEAKQAKRDKPAVSGTNPRTPSQSSGRWLTWLNRGNDDKPKPIRAKLGEQNKFVYDEKLKRWINKDIPLEEQLAPAAPPPPPKKATNVNASRGASGPGITTGPVPNRAPSGPTLGPGVLTPPSVPSNNRSDSPQKSVKNALLTDPPSQINTPPTASTAPPARKPNLASAGLDDLLSLGGSTASVSSRKGKRGARRGYVNVLEN